MGDIRQPGETGIPPAIASVDECEAYRRQRAGLPISEELEQHLAGLTPNERAMLDTIAGGLDEQDKRVRDEINRYPEGYGWHKTVGGGLPFDWSDSELPLLRPQDWTQAREVHFVRVASPKTAKQARPAARSREHRHGHRRTRSTRAGPESSDPDEPEPPLWRHPRYGRVNRLLAAFLDHQEVVE